MVPTKELLDRIAQQEKELVLDHFTEDDAWVLGCLIVDEAKQRQAHIAIDIRRPAQILFTLPSMGPLPTMTSGYAASQM